VKEVSTAAIEIMNKLKTDISRVFLPFFSFFSCFLFSECLPLEIQNGVSFSFFVIFLYSSELFFFLFCFV